MTRRSAGVVALVLVLSGCGGGGGSPAPESIDTCEGLVSAAVDLMQTAIDQMDQMSLQDLSAAETNAPAAFDDLERQGALLEQRAGELGCSGEQLADLMAAEVDRLHSDTMYGQQFIESVRSGDVTLFGG